MHATADAREKARMGDAFPRLERTASSGQPVTIPDPAGDFVHLQFRRFAGCPICNLHLRSIVRRYDEVLRSRTRRSAARMWSNMTWWFAQTCPMKRKVTAYD